MRVDVCIVAEGSYPYITGGVSSWVHQLILGMPDVRFGVLALLPDESFPRVDKYPLPSNVVARRDVFLFGAPPQTSRKRNASKPLSEALLAMHEAPLSSRCPHLQSVARLVRDEKQDSYALMTARTSWALMHELRRRTPSNISFLDYFWSWRSIHAPLFRLFESEYLEADVYHPVSTGYAGFIAALAKLRHGSRMVLTEHGIYTREREIEISNAEWIYTEPSDASRFVPYEPFFKGWWRKTYRFLGQTTYDLADRIVTLSAMSRELQVNAGAPADRIEIVPNGIDPLDYRGLVGPRDWSERPFRVGLIGRVVPIKDVKTFLRAAQLAAAEIPLEAYVLGPTDEDPAYFEACRELTRLLGIEDVVTFAGQVDVRAWLPRLDVNVLTSVSESQPLVILEASAAGVPTIASNVGACAEMLNGQVGDDALLGPSGLVTSVASPDETAAAIVALARQPLRHAELAQAGLQRVERFYRQEEVCAHYRNLYRELAERPVEAT